MSPAEKEAREEMADRKMRKAAEKAYNKEMPEPDTTFGKLGRKAAGAVLAVPAGISGATLLGLLPGSPGVIDSAKYGAKTMYHTVNGDKKANDEAEKEYMDAAKRAQSVETKRDSGENTNSMGDTFKKGGKVASKYMSFSKSGKPAGMKEVKKMSDGGSASKRADGIAQRGKTRGKMC
jgi:hypothetical protein